MILIVSNQKKPAQLFYHIQCWQDNETNITTVDIRYSFRAIYTFLLASDNLSLKILHFQHETLILVDGGGLRTHFSDPLRTLRSSGYTLSGIYITANNFLR